MRVMGWLGCAALLAAATYGGALAIEASGARPASDRDSLTMLIAKAPAVGQQVRLPRNDMRGRAIGPARLVAWLPDCLNCTSSRVSDQWVRRLVKAKAVIVIESMSDKTVATWPSLKAQDAIVVTDALGSTLPGMESPVFRPSVALVSDGKVVRSSSDDKTVKELLASGATGGR